MSLSRLRGSAQEPLGVTIVMDDVTEKKRFERERNMVRRYLPPELVDSLPEDLDELRLRGKRQVITTLFADIRGFTSFSEDHSPETVVEVINRYFAMAAEVVRKHHGIVDKYLGDAVMAVFNTPLLEISDHAWNAVQAAWELKQMIKHHHKDVEPELRMNFGVGICTGEAVVGNVGALDSMDYTAIGDAVNVAKRLQENADGGQVVMSLSTWEQLRDRVRVNQLPSVRLKGRRTTTEVFELLGLIG
jgi:class 3 adenylate cyclase